MYVYIYMYICKYLCIYKIYIYIFIQTKSSTVLPFDMILGYLYLSMINRHDIAIIGPLSCHTGCFPQLRHAPGYDWIHPKMGWHPLWK